MPFKWATDYWLTQDKWAHVGGCCVFNFVLYVLISTSLFQLSFIAALAWASAFTFSLGAAYEVRDGLANDGFSYKDAIADVIGILISIIAVLVLTY